MKSYYLVSLLTISYAWNLILVNGLVHLEDCKTPNQKYGKCVLVKECPVIKEIVSRHTLSPGDINYLEKSKCGISNDNTHKAFVCCPLDHVTIETVTEEIKEFLNSVTRLSDTTETTTIVDDFELKTTTEALKHEKLLPSNCKFTEASQMLEGDTASLTDFPCLALLEMQKKNGKKKFFCTGALINEKYVLTAANCIETAAKEMGKITSVRLGEWDLSSDADSAIDVSVEKIIQHENYQSSAKNLLNDIALIRLIDKVNFNEFICPICLPQQKKDEHLLKFKAAGWGILNGRPKYQRKRVTSLISVNRNECQKTYLQTQLKDFQICATIEAGKEKCFGDTGGPLILISETTEGSNYYIAGINSFGIGCFADGEPDIYTEVYSFLDWIYSNLEP